MYHSTSQLLVRSKIMKLIEKWKSERNGRRRKKEEFEQRKNQLNPLSCLCVCVYPKFPVYQTQLLPLVDACLSTFGGNIWKILHHQNPRPPTKEREKKYVSYALSALKMQ